MLLFGYALSIAECFGTICRKVVISKDAKTRDCFSSAYFAESSDGYLFVETEQLYELLLVFAAVVQHRMKLLLQVC